MRPQDSPTSRYRTRSRSTRGALRAGVPLLAVVAMFSCTAYAPALEHGVRGNPDSANMQVMHKDVHPAVVRELWDVDPAIGGEPVAGCRRGLSRG